MFLNYDTTSLRNSLPLALNIIKFPLNTILIVMILSLGIVKDEWHAITSS